MKYINRRQVLKHGRNGGLALTTGALIANLPPPTNSLAGRLDQKEEAEKQRRADVKMTIATEVPLALSNYYPLVQMELKRNIETASKGSIYVRLADGGSMGKGSRLAAKVRQNKVEVAQHSISNFAPFAPVVDLLNIPYWANTNQRFVNLVTSELWRSQVHPKIQQKGFDVLLYVVLDPRTAATSKRLETPIRTPKDVAGVKFRVPGSQILRQFYSLCGAIPVPVPWGDTRDAIINGQADALDPAITALYVSGIWDQLSTVSFIKSVEDAQVYSVNLAWLESLTPAQRLAVRSGAEMTFRNNLEQVPIARNNVMKALTDGGVRVYTPNSDELSEWAAVGGADRPEWDGIINRLAGSRRQFDQLKDMANIENTYTVNDIE